MPNIPELISKMATGNGVFKGDAVFALADGSFVDKDGKEVAAASPIAASAYSNFEGFAVPSEVTAEATALSAAAASGAISTHNSDAGAHADKESKSNKVTSISSESTDEQYPSAKCVYSSAMRLLISRTIGAGENVSAITWTQDDAGNALALIDMDLRIRIPSNPVAVGTTGSVSLRLNGITSADSYITNTSKSTYTVANYYRTNYGNSIAKLENVGGYMLGTVYYIRDDGTTFGGGNHPIGTLFSAANISQINISINNITYFPTGTVIEIYGRTA